jgi:endonuclease/exonuclease/phosphatase family metal-dependent hydrolase
MTYNIRGGLGMDNRRSTARIAETVREAAPDVVCFQEVHRRLPWSRMVDQPGRLARLLGMPVTFQANLRLAGLGGYGIAIASRFPVRESFRHFLPSVGEQRGALEVRLADAADVGGDVTVFCTHWGLSGEERLRQATALAERIAVAPRPVIVCGDLNERASEPAVADLLARTGLRDADAGADRPTFPAGTAATARIDFIFHSDDLRAADVTVGASEASDHCPLWADLVLARHDRGGGGEGRGEPR